MSQRDKMPSNRKTEDKANKSKKSKRPQKNVDMSKIKERFHPYPGPFRKSKLLKDCINTNDYEKCFRDKIESCCILIDFVDPRTAEERDLKQKALMEILESMNKLNQTMPDYIYGCITLLFGCNVFRSLAPFHPVMLMGIEDEEDFQLVESWPHLQFVYEILLKFLEHPDFNAKKAKMFIDPLFVVCLLNVFDSADPRERDYLKTVLHRIYGKMIPLRSYMRKQINNVFYTFVYETNHHNGVAELLEILGSIINGFQIPLKDEHKIFLKHVLLPLHKPNQLGNYHPQLSYCVIEFIKKETNLIKVVLNDGLIKFWPKMNSFKEILFLNELEECLECCDKHNFKLIQEPLFKQLAKCVNSPNFQVCERTLYYWTNQEIVELMHGNTKTILPIIFPALYASKHHWNKAIHSMVFNTLKVMMDMDPKVFDEYTTKFKDERYKDKEKLQIQQEMWKRVYQKAKKNPLSRSYSESISMNLVEKVSENKEIDRNLKGLTAEIKKHASDDMIKKPINRSPSSASKTPDYTAKEDYSFKN